MKESMLGYEINNLPVKHCIASITKELDFASGDSEHCMWLACINPHSYAVALDDVEFDRALRDADWLVPDGVGIVLASHILSGSIRERVTGSDIFFGLHQHMNAKGGMTVFFLGATEETLAQMSQRMALDYPDIRIVGTYSPPFRQSYSLAELNDIIDSINAVEPDVLWVGMTAPKQEKWIYDNHARLKVRFAGAVGAVFDFYTGRVRRSHTLFQRLGLEWLPRLVQQPRRLWRRIFLSAPIFIWHVIKARLTT